MEKRSGVVASLAFAIVAACRPPAEPAGAGALATTTVPLQVTTKHFGLGIFAPVRVGAGAEAQPATVLVDTGSAGLSVLRSALRAGTYVPTGRPAKVFAVDNMVLDGEEATAVVAIGEARTPAPITIVVVDGVSCASSKPKCPGTAGERALVDRGYAGILGTGLRTSDGATVLSPIAQLAPGSRSYAIHLDRDAGAGSLTIALGAEALAAFAFVKLEPDLARNPSGAPVWNDAAVPVCWSVAGAPIAASCKPETVVDSGATTLVVLDGAIPAAMIDGAFVATATPFEASIAGVFTWNGASGNHEVLALGINAPRSPRSLGMPFFEAFDVAYDIDRGRIGFRRARTSR